jgi:two-component system chemotaxis response regulator CheY
MLSGVEIAEYHQAGNGKEALSVLEGHWVDLILTDINMPVMDGEEFLARLRQDELYKDIPVIVVSTDGTEHRMQRLIALGAKDYVSKPFAPETLRSGVERVLGV